MTSAPSWAEYTRPDEVAETWDGIIKVEGLYEALWGFVPEIPSYQDNIEDIGPDDVIGIDCLAPHWDKLSPAHQAELIRLESEQIWNK